MTYRLTLVSEAVRRRALRLVAAAPLGHVVTIKEPTRTGEQNAKLWAMLNAIAMAKPDGRRHTPDTWKALFMQALGHEQVFEVGLDGRPFPLGFRSSKLSKKEMSDLLAFVESWAAERGIKTGEQE